MVLEEMGIPSGNNCIACEESSVAMIGMQAVSLPRIVTEDNRRPESPNLSSKAAEKTSVVFEFSVDLVEEDDLTRGSESRGRFDLFSAAQGDQRVDVGVGIPRPFGSVGQNGVVHHATRRCPFRQGPAAPELDVVRVSSDGQSDRWNIDIDAGDTRGFSEW